MAEKPAVPGKEHVAGEGLSPPFCALNNEESKEEKPITCFTPEDAFIARLDIGGCQLAGLDVYTSGHYRDHML